MLIVRIFSKIFQDHLVKEGLVTVGLSLLFFLFIFILARIVLQRTPKFDVENKENKPLLLTSFFSVVLLTCLAGFPNLEIIKLSILILILLYASASDIQDRSVNDSASVMLVILGFVNVNALTLMQNLFAGISAFVIFLIIAIVMSGKLGAADIKIAGACCFVLGFEIGFAGLILGLIFAVIITTVLRKKQKSDDKSLPLVPYLSAGFVLMTIVSAVTSTVNALIH